MKTVDEIRKEIMPIANKWGIDELLESTSAEKRIKFDFSEIENILKNLCKGEIKNGYS